MNKTPDKGHHAERSYITENLSRYKKRKTLPKCDAPVGRGRHGTIRKHPKHVISLHRRIHHVLIDVQRQQAKDIVSKARKVKGRTSLKGKGEEPESGRVSPSAKQFAMIFSPKTASRKPAEDLEVKIVPKFVTEGAGAPPTLRRSVTNESDDESVDSVTGETRKRRGRPKKTFPILDKDLDTQSNGSGKSGKRVTIVDSSEMNGKVEEEEEEEHSETMKKEEVNEEVAPPPAKVAVATEPPTQVSMTTGRRTRRSLPLDADSGTATVFPPLCGVHTRCVMSWAKDTKRTQCEFCAKIVFVWARVARPQDKAFLSVVGVKQCPSRETASPCINSRRPSSENGAGTFSLGGGDAPRRFGRPSQRRGILSCKSRCSEQISPTHELIRRTGAAPWFGGCSGSARFVLQGQLLWHRLLVHNPELPNQKSLKRGNRKRRRPRPPRRFLGRPAQSPRTPQRPRRPEPNPKGRHQNFLQPMELHLRATNQKGRWWEASSHWPAPHSHPRSCANQKRSKTLRSRIRNSYTMWTRNCVLWLCTK